MEKALSKDLENLEKTDKERTTNIVSVVFDTMLEKVQKKEKELSEITARYSKKGERENALIDFIASYLDEAFKDCLAVPCYIQKSKAKQDILIFVGTHWQSIVYQQFIDFVRECCRKMGLIDCLIGDHEFMNTMLEQLAFRRSHHQPNKVPQGDVWINMKNGTLEIHESGYVNFREHKAEDFITYCLPYAYEEKAECPLWLNFLNRVIPEPEMQMVLAEYIGYCFTKSMKLEKMAVFYGTGCNGKSVTMDLIERIMGKENVSHISLSAATTDDEKRTHLEGKLVNISPESGKEIDAATLKQLVSGEPINVRKLYVGSYIIYDYAKLMTSFNQLPPTERTYGYFRRWLLFPFQVTIPEEEQDINLVNKLSDELSGIMNWVLEGLKRLTTSKTFTNSPACVTALSEYRKRTNSALMFLSERCELSEMEITKLKDLYQEYVKYCNAEGIQCKLSKRSFKDSLELFEAEKTVQHHTDYYNIKIVSYED